MRSKEIGGERFGRLLALRVERKEGYRQFWRFKCDCGVEKVIEKGSVVWGKVKSCGCLHRERLRLVPRTHGRTKTRVHRVWTHMKSRCLNKRDAGYPNYGGRGITVSEPWMQFENFLADMGEPPIGMSLDRIDNTKGYSKENCRWASRKQQALNTRRNHLVTFRGVTRPLGEWAEKYGLPASTLRLRLTRYHWPVERALTTRLRGRR